MSLKYFSFSFFIWIWTLSSRAKILRENLNFRDKSSNNSNYFPSWVILSLSFNSHGTSFLSTCIIIVLWISNAINAKRMLCFTLLFTYVPFTLHQLKMKASAINSNASSNSIRWTIKLNHLSRTIGTHKHIHWGLPDLPKYVLKPISSVKGGRSPRLLKSSRINGRNNANEDRLAVITEAPGILLLKP